MSINKKLTKGSAFLLLIACFFQFSCQAMVENDQQSLTCTKIYKLSEDEILDKIRFSKEGYEKILKVDGGIRYKEPCNAEGISDTASQVSADTEGWRVISSWNKPELMLGNLCRSDFTEVSGIDEEWLKPQYRSEFIYVTLLGQEQAQCLDIELDEYIKADKGILDSEVQLVLSFMEEITREFAASLNEDVENIWVDGLSTSRGRDGVTYYELEVSQEGRPRPYRLLLEKSPENILSIKFINK